MISWSTYAWYRTAKSSQLARESLYIVTILFIFFGGNTADISQGFLILPLTTITVLYKQCIFQAYSLSVTDFVHFDQYLRNHQLHHLHKIFGDRNVLSRCVRPTMLRSTRLRPCGVSHPGPGLFLSVPCHLSSVFFSPQNWLCHFLSHSPDEDA